MTKRIFDILVSIILLILFSFILLFIALLIRIKLGRPVLFKQLRPGKDGKIFQMIKFRSMTDKKDKSGQLLNDADRLTSFGKKLRSSSLDELPELINVLKGEMSLVGPRPLLPEYLPLYNDYQNRRHEVKPGITGWAQVNGRNAITWEEKFEYDVWYVENKSFWLDLKILFETFFKVIKSENVLPEKNIVMHKFEGSK